MERQQGAGGGANPDADQLGIKHISIARDGEEAFGAMMAAPSHLSFPTFIMPKLSGLGLLRAVHEFEPIRKAAFILMSGRCEYSEMEQANKYGVDSFLAKPFTVFALRVAVEGVVGKMGERQSRAQ